MIGSGKNTKKTLVTIFIAHDMSETKSSHKNGFLQVIEAPTAVNIWGDMHIAVAFNSVDQLASTGMHDRTTEKILARANTARKTIALWLASSGRSESCYTYHPPETAFVDQG